MQQVDLMSLVSRWRNADARLYVNTKASTVDGTESCEVRILTRDSAIETPRSKGVRGKKTKFHNGVSNHYSKECGFLLFFSLA